MTEEPTAKEIIQEHATYFAENIRNFKGSVLGYVTPWNNRGYDIAKNFSSKFTHISPVWLQVKRLSAKKYELGGTHDIDQKWMNAVRKNNPAVHIDVRVFFDRWTGEDFTALFSDIGEQEALARTVTEACTAYKFNGIVLEIWSQIGGRLNSEILVDFVKLVAKNLKKSGFELILVIPPHTIFDAGHFQGLYDSVAGFSMMTYDFSSPQKPGPNSPLSWMKECVEKITPDGGRQREKILLGLNFYGNSYTPSGGGPILGRDVVKLLKDYKGKLKFDDSSVENYFEVK